MRYCITCLFHDGDESFMQCRRYAPQPYGFYRYYIGEILRDIAWSSRAMAKIEEPSPEDDIAIEATETDTAEITGWPVVSAHDWCGEWRAEEKQPVEVDGGAADGKGR